MSVSDSAVKHPTKNYCIMQNVYNYVLHTKHVAAVLYLQSVLHVMLFRTLNGFCTSTLALPAVCVQCPMWLFLQFLNSCSPDILLRYCLCDLEIVPVPPIITGLLLLLLLLFDLTQYCAGDKIEKNEMGWACGAYG